MTKGGVLSPVIISFPGQIKPGTRSDSLATVMDLLPTFLDVAQHKHPGNQYEGREVVEPLGASLMPVLSGLASEVHGQDHVFAMEIFDRRMLQKGKWKIVWHNPPWGKDRAWELYDLEADPTELEDLSDDRPEVLAMMKSEWVDYVDRVGMIPNSGYVLPIGATDSHYKWLPPDLR